MCCSREHYPKEVGLHLFDPRQRHHHHLILPWSNDIGICVTGSGSGTSVVWRDFNPVSSRMAVVGVSLGRGGRHLADLLSGGIAEGGRLSRAWLDEVVTQYAKQYHRKPMLSGDDGGFVIEPPEALEYHEWLLVQAQRELAGRN